MKIPVYNTPVDIAEELVTRIAVVAGEIRDMYGFLMYSMLRCEVCIVAGGRNFEHLLGAIYVLLFYMYYKNDFSLTVSFHYGAFVNIPTSGKHFRPQHCCMILNRQDAPYSTYEF